jgi:hypothetical protein
LCQCDPPVSGNASRGALRTDGFTICAVLNLEVELKMPALYPQLKSI